MTDGPPGREGAELARFRLAADELLDLALETRWKLAHEADSPGAADLEQLVDEIGGRVARWREQLRGCPMFEERAGERLRHAQNIMAECAAILAARPPGGRA